MNIWLINPYGQIPGEGWRDYRFTMLGKALAKRGHQALWWTASFSHTFKRFRSDSWRDIPVVSRFNIRLVPTTSYAKNVSLGRIRFECNYAWQIYRRAAKVEPPDCIIATDPPQIVGYIAEYLAKSYRVPLILDVFDLWPELFILAFPRLLRPFAPIVFAPLYWLRRHNLCRANALTSLCNTYLEAAKREVPRTRHVPSLTIYNGIDIAAFRATRPDANAAMELNRQFGKNPDDVWAIYAGTLGNSYDIDTLLRAGLDLDKRASHIKIWIVGEGPLRSRVMKFIEAHRLKNVAYLGTHLESDDLIKLYQNCDIALCPYAPESNVAMPNKAYDYMAAGLPIVNSLRGELEDFLREHDSGIQYIAADSNSLVSVLESLAANEERRQEMAQNSFDAAIEFDEHVQYGKYVDLIELSLGEKH